ncbi:MAG: type II toxin-antitoxin system HicA family toxin [Synergistaceae bacterium]|nr:type II toxin-antitoxin system HicA family toxin [Synergistaceae bacterium]MBR0185497.1 type II toxin-antitoxin system HicA family toxin [Synergistaceae bacterium]
MSRLEKAIERLKTVPKDYTYSEAKYLLGQLGFIEDNKGRTSGSRVKFERQSDGEFVLLHKPHPSDVLIYKSVYGLKRFLERIGEI